MNLLELDTLRLSAGVDTRSRAPKTAPADLVNARVEPDGLVRALRAPSPWAGLPDADGVWVEHPNGLYASGDLAGFQSADVYRGVLYVSADGGAGARRLVALEKDWDGASLTSGGTRPNLPTVLARVRSGFRIVSSSSIPDEPSGPSSASIVSYLLVPLNDRDEAGPWMRYTARGQNPPDAVSSRVDFHEFSVGPETHRVEVYRSLEAELAEDAPFSQVGYDGDVPLRRDALERGYFLLGRFPVEDGEVRFEDPHSWALDAFEVGSIPNLGSLQRRETLAARSASGAVTPPTARAMLNVTDVMVYGGAARPLHRPHVDWSGFSQGPEASRRYRLAFQCEFETQEGPKYGPVVYDPWKVGHGFDIWTAPHRAVNVVPGFETALLTWIDVSPTDSGDWRLLERLVPTSFGTYQSKLADKFVYTRKRRGRGETQEDILIEKTFVPFAFSGEDRADARAYYQGLADLSVSGPYPVTDYVEERDVAYLSRQNRPREVTAATFATPSGRGIVALAPAQVRAEDNQTVDFYAFTDREVYYGARSGEVVPLREVSRTYGVTGPEMLAPVEGGLAAITSDGRVRLFAGRDTVRDVDEAVYRTWGTPRAIAYARTRRELYVATDEGRVWALSFDGDDVRGWSVCYDMSATALAANGPFVAARTSGGDVRLDEGGVVLPARVATQPLPGIADEGALVSTLGAFAVDCDTTERRPIVSTTAGDPVVTASSGDAFTADMVGARIRVPGVGGGGRDLVATIERVISATSALLSPAPRTNAVGKTAVVWPAAEARHTVQAPTPGAARPEEVVPIHPRRPRVLRLRGSDHQIEVSGFSALRSLHLGASPD